MIGTTTETMVTIVCATWTKMLAMNANRMPQKTTLAHSPRAARTQLAAPALMA
jgi:hypothetical protein